ncbi:MAG: signal recognition particle protein Srp19, partial [Candidatus Micrarchaeaceae archaeon]
IVEAFKPDEKLLVINADTGQVAGSQARGFNDAVGVDGVIITKLDGSGKGGGALSAVNEAKARVTMIGVGEKLNAIELFDPKKYVGRLLGIPDIEGLIAKVNEAVKEANIKPEDVNVETLTFDTFYTQLKAMQKMGPLKNIVGMMGMPDMPSSILDQSESKFKKYEAIIGSMTKEERSNGSLMHNSSRVRRVAMGSGTEEKDVRQLVSDFEKMKKIMKMIENDRNLRKKMGKFIQSM